MTDSRNLQDLFRRAVLAQMELGMTEAVLSPVAAIPTSPAITPQSYQSESPVAVEPTFFSGDSLSSESASFASLDEHFKAICECQLCPLGRTRNKFVYGVGNPNAKLMFIGEGPGADEDAKGEPFVGRAGQLLDKIMAAIQLDRTQIYIANVVKCRPPENRVPTPKEMETCFPYLKEQIRLIKPKLLCALGKTAAQALIGEVPALGKVRGRWHDFQGIPLLITYHPAALLRDPAYKKGTWEDMQVLRARYDSI
jgi:DNA polymerase